MPLCHTLCRTNSLHPLFHLVRWTYQIVDDSGAPRTSHFQSAAIADGPGEIKWCGSQLPVLVEVVTSRIRLNCRIRQYCRARRYNNWLRIYVWLRLATDGCGSCGLTVPTTRSFRTMIPIRSYSYSYSDSCNNTKERHQMLQRFTCRQWENGEKWHWREEGEKL